MTKSFVENIIRTTLSQGIGPYSAQVRESLFSKYETNQKEVDASIRKVFLHGDEENIRLYLDRAFEVFEGMFFLDWMKEKGYFRQGITEEEHKKNFREFCNENTQFKEIRKFLLAYHCLNFSYRMGKDLLECLIEDDPPTEIDLLVDKDCHYLIELPDGLEPRSKEDTEAIGRDQLVKYCILSSEQVEENRLLSFVFFGCRERDRSIEGVSYLRFTLKRLDGGKQTLQDFFRDSLKEQSHMSEILRVFSLCAAYINSGQPDMREYRPPVMPENASRRARDKWQNEHQGRDPIPAVLVGYDWRKPRLYHVNESHRRAFWRWQPHGPGNKLRKWTLVKETTVKYNKSEVLPG